MRKSLWPLLVSFAVGVLTGGCGNHGSTPTTPSPPMTPTSINHIVIVVEENASYESVIGAPSMPYLNTLVAQYSLATQYFANTHPSIGNYFMLTVGNPITNNNDFSDIVTDDNIVRQLIAGGKTWKSYAEDLPAVGYTGGDRGGYARKHNVLALLADVVNNPAQVANLVPFSQLSPHLATHPL